MMISRRNAALVTILMVGLASSVADAATIRVPADVLTIQGAIDSADSGDLILVSDGVYNETIWVDVPNLTIQSVNGRNATSISSNPGISQPIIFVDAPGVTIGGIGQGFTIQHEGFQAKDIVALSLAASEDGAASDDAAVRFEENRVVGNRASFGLRTLQSLSGTSLRITNNQFEGQFGTDYGFRTVIGLGASEQEGANPISLNAGSVSVSNNLMRDFSVGAIRVTGESYASELAITQNQIEGLATGSTYGLNLSAPVMEQSTVTIVGNDFNKIALPIDAYTFDDGASLSISGNAISAFGGRCIAVYTIGNGSDASITGNTITSESGEGGDSCVRFYNVEFGSTLNITGNSIDVAGRYDDAIYVYTVWQNSHATIADNEVRGYRLSGLEVNDYVEQSSTVSVSNNAFAGDEQSGSVAGINFPYTIVDNSVVTVSGNSVRGFTLYGINFDDISDGGSVQCTNNTVLGTPAGSEFGIVFNNVRGSEQTSSVTGNTIGNIKSGDPATAGIYVRSTHDSPAIDVIGNTVGAHVDGAPNGILFAIGSSGGELLVDGNEVSGFSNAALSFDSATLETTAALIRGNLFVGGEYGVEVTSSLSDATVMEMSSNQFLEFTVAAIRTTESISDTSLKISRNEFSGDGVGVLMEGEITDSSDVEITSNCFGLVFKGVSVTLISEIAEVVLRNNDFSGVFGVAIENKNSDAANEVDADGNFLAGKTITGEVRFDNELLTAPDDDGDGVSNCGDVCPNTPVAEPVNDAGCAILVDDEPSPNAPPSGDRPGNNPPPSGDACGIGVPTVAASLAPIAIFGFGGNRRRRAIRRDS